MWDYNLVDYTIGCDLTPPGSYFEPSIYGDSNNYNYWECAQGNKLRKKAQKDRKMMQMK